MRGPLLPAFAPQKSVIGKLGADMVFLVKCPDWETLKAVTNDPEHLAIHHYREEATTDSLPVRR